MTPDDEVQAMIMMVADEHSLDVSAAMASAGAVPSNSLSTSTAVAEDTEVEDKLASRLKALRAEAS